MGLYNWFMNDNTAYSDWGAISGLKVIDLSRVLGGPYCSQILGDHGANVIKVEPPQGDETRDWGPPFRDDESSSYYVGVNRNKSSMGLDLAVPQGRDVLMRLLHDADVLLENFKPGTMEKWGLSYESNLQSRFPRLIHARISGFGEDGPLGGFPGYDAIVQAMSGLFSVNGTPETGPLRMGTAIVDIGTGLYTAIAILMALLERERSGRGQYIDMTLYDCALSLMHPHVSNYYLSGKVPVPTGNAHTNLSPYDKFKTSTCDIFLGAGNDRAFSRLCDVIGMPDLAKDDRFLRNSDRLENRKVLTQILEEIFAEQDGFEICRMLLKSGIPAGPVMNTQDAFMADHTLHREMAIDRHDYQGAGIPIKLRRTPGQIHRAPPTYGQDSAEVLVKYGFNTDEITKLIDDGVVLQKRRGK